MASVQLELHPLLKQLQLLVGTSANEGLKLNEVMQYAKFQWVAVYVITDAGRMIVKTLTSGKAGTVARMEAFGGSMDKPSNIVFAIAKLRSELADESSITITKDNLVRMSPLMVLRDGLVQIVMVKQTWVDSQRLWVPESARQHWYFGRRNKGMT
jgi:hypothetical protein